MIEDVRIESISAITLFTADMPSAVAFYEALGFELIYGGANDPFSSFVLVRATLTSPLALHRNPYGGELSFMSVMWTLCTARRLRSASSRVCTVRRALKERYFHIRDPDDG